MRLGLGDQNAENQRPGTVSEMPQNLVLTPLKVKTRL